MKFSRTMVLTLAVLLLLTAIGFAYGHSRAAAEPIRVGVLHSLTGTMAISESAVVEATLLAIDEINQRGGLLGRQIQPLVVDGASDWQTFADEAERLITEEQVSVIFGCWTSACRRTVKPIFEKHNHLLFYPVQYEGLEQSPNIVYLGAAPNQQIIPAVRWSLEHLGKRFFLIGSDYVFPRAANTIMRDQINTMGGRIVGEAYILLGSADVDAVVEEIASARPDVILNTINGDTNLAFFEALRAAGITPEDTPTMSFSIAEAEAQTLGVANLVGDYAAWNYFQSIATPENRAFVSAFRAKYGRQRVVSDPMEAAYVGVHLWAQAVEDVGTPDVTAVREAIGDQSYSAPGGIAYIDRETQHTWKPVRIGQLQADGQFNIVWDSQTPIRPVPYPTYRIRSDWNTFVSNLYNTWGGQWANPGS